jgi:NADPH:quinone reductase-like Zn-dependent oxidoreductase
MKAVFLVKNGKSSSAFEIRDFTISDPEPNEVQIKVQAFGLNFADIMARMGLYPDAPKKPGILGYDVVGNISKIGKDVPEGLEIGARVIALTRFGGYAQVVNTDYRAIAPIGASVPADLATALATQAGTAYYMAREMVNIFPGDHILVHAAAGGVGSILCQMALDSGATVFGTASSTEKLKYLASIGVHHPINYKEEDFSKKIKILLPEGQKVDVIFDAIGGKSVSKGFKLLDSGGRMVLFGASALTSAKFIWSKIGVALGFGIYSPIGLLNPSKSLIGINMLRIADDKPDVIGRVIQGAVDLFNDGIIKPEGGGIYSIDELAQAHGDLENRKTKGKLAIEW